MEQPSTVADVWAEALAAAGVERLYGIPGGGTSALVVAGEARGLRFVLTHGETSAAVMASVDAERTGRPGVVVTSNGPGAAAVVNGIAHARLDRAPLLLFTDRQPDATNAEGYHQWLHQAGLFAPVVKGSVTLTDRDVGPTLAHAVDLALADPPGPVHVDVPVGLGRRPAQGAGFEGRPGRTPPRPGLAAEVRDLVRSAHRPLLIAGLGARTLSGGVLERVADNLRAPVLATYKGKGAIDERSPWAAAILMSAGAERDLLDRADLVVSIGVDSVELFASVPDLAGRRVALDTYRPPPGVLAPPVHEAIGDLDHLLLSLPEDGASRWEADEVVAARRDVAARLAAAPSGDAGGLHPWEVARVIAEAHDDDADIAVDAGAHMLPIAEAWRTRRPGAFVISNGLATMGFGLPAATSRSIADRERRVVCCTGDGGLLMVAGELATAAREANRLTIVVFDDRSLSLIRVKQVDAEIGRAVEVVGPDWVEVARGFGIASTQVGDLDGLRKALEAAAQEDTPQLIVVPIDHVPYGSIIETLRA